MNLVRRAGTALLGAAALAGCLPPVTFPTPSGNPETFIEGVTKHAVMDMLVGAAASAGQTMRSSSEYQIVLEEPMTGIGAVLLGSEYNPTPVWRETWTLVDQAGGVRIIGAIVAVTNPGSAFESLTDATHGKAGQQMQLELNALRGRMLREKAASTAPGRP